MGGDFTVEQLQYWFPYLYKKRGLKLKDTVDTPPRVAGARVEHGIPVKDGEILKLFFESVNSDWAQGVHLEIDKSIVIKGIEYRTGIVIFSDAKHPELPVLTCRTKEGMLWVWNVWDYHTSSPDQQRRSVMSKELYCGMLVEELPNGYRYRCNEGRDDDDYDDLIFRIERTSREA